jgi:hypothetical protein
MSRLKAIPGGKGGRGKEKTLSLVYGLRLYPADKAGQIEQIVEGEVQLRDGSASRVPLHIIEGTRDQIRAQLLASIDAFFDIYSDEALETSLSGRSQQNEADDAGC